MMFIKTTQFFIIKIPNKKELQEIAFYDINLYKNVLQNHILF